MVTAMHDGIATLRRSFIVVRGEVYCGPTAVEDRRIMATPKFHTLRQPSLFTLRGGEKGARNHIRQNSQP